MIGAMSGEIEPARLPPSARWCLVGFRANTNRVYVGIIEQAHVWIGEHYSEHDATLDRFSKETGWARRTVQRALDWGGYGPWRQLLKERRMFEAARLLISDQNTKIADIAFRVGYKQPPQFAKAFSDIYGHTPSAYRRGGAPE